MMAAPSTARRSGWTALAHLLFVPLLASQATDLQGQGPEAWAARAPEYGVVTARSVMVPARDGTRLATDIYFPAVDGERAPGTFPTLVERTPYGKNGERFRNVGRYFASRGYVTVVQDIRGRFESEGEFYIYVNDGPDGYDAVEWIAEQPWSDGRVASIGGSYSAATLHALGALGPPHWSAYFVREGTASYHEDVESQGGAFKLTHNVGYALGLAANGDFALSDPVVARHFEKARGSFEDWLQRPPLDLLHALEPDPEVAAWYRDWVLHPDLDGYWRQNGYEFESRYDDFPDVPAYYLGGWFDGIHRGTMTNYQAFAERRSSPVKLIVGPWIHGPANIDRRVTGDVDFGAAAQVDYDALRVRWFDQVLKGEDTGILDEPPVLIFVMGGGSGAMTPGGHLDHGGRWRWEEAWPPPDAEPTPYYLQEDGGLAPSRPSASESSTSYRFDPEDPVPTLGGRMLSGGDVVPSGPYERRCRPEVFNCDDTLPIAARGDVLVFETPPLERDVEVVGPVEVKLWVASTAPDTDFTARLVDVYPANEDYPSGYALDVADGMIRARYRGSTAEPETMEPGSVHELTVDLWTTATLFQEGHRIRVEVSSSNFPEYSVNPNTGEPVETGVRKESAINTIHHDRQHPSRVVLPLRSPDP